MEEEYNPTYRTGNSGELVENDGTMDWHLCPKCGCNLSEDDEYSTCGCGWEG